LFCSFLNRDLLSFYLKRGKNFARTWVKISSLARSLCFAFRVGRNDSY